MNHSGSTSSPRSRELAREPGGGVPSRGRLQVLKDILESGDGTASTQDELREKLQAQGFEVTQSTISRDLRRLGAIKTIDEQGRTIYRLGGDVAPPPGRSSLTDLITAVESSGSIIVIHTPPGTASLVARHLDHYKPGGILGTIAGDDTIFVAPASVKAIPATIAAIRQSLLAAR